MLTSTDSLSWTTVPAGMPRRWHDLAYLIVFLIQTVASFLLVAFASPGSWIHLDSRAVRLLFIVTGAASIATLAVVVVHLTCIGRCSRHLLSAAVRFCAVAVLAAILTIVLVLHAYMIGAILLGAFALTSFVTWLVADSFLDRPALTSSLLWRSRAWFLQHGPMAMLVVPPVAAIGIVAAFAVVAVRYLQLAAPSSLTVPALVSLSLGLVWWMSIVVQLVHGLMFAPVHAWFITTATVPTVPNLSAILGRYLSWQAGTVIWASIVVPVLSLCRWHARVSQKCAFVTGAFYARCLEVLDGRLGQYHRMSLYGALLSNESLSEGGRRISARLKQHDAAGQLLVNDFAPAFLSLLSATSSGAVSAALAVVLAVLGLGPAATVEVIQMLVWASFALGALLATLTMTVFESCAWSLLLCWISDPARMRVLDPELDADLSPISQEYL